jgi:NTE family protein
MLQGMTYTGLRTIFTGEARRMSGKRIGLALGGGGARGLCHIEFCKALDDMGVKPDIMAGTSIGAVVGAFYAGGMSGAKMEELLSGLGFKQYSRMLDLSLKKGPGLLKGKNVMKFFYEHLPYKTFKSLKIPLAIVATDMWSWQEVVFDSGRLVPALRASISVPGVFEPIRKRRRLLFDGGAVNPLPMDLIRDRCDVLIAVDVTGTGKKPSSDRTPSLFETLMLWSQIMENALIQDAVGRCRPEIYLKPDLKDVQILDFHREKEIRAGVKKDVARFKKKLKDALKD